MKRSSLWFLFALVVILVFVVGVRYGQNVAETNKTISYLLSVTPTKAVVNQLEFKAYNHPGCGLGFLYPNQLTVPKEKESSTGATFYDGKETTIEIDCAKDSKLALIVENKNVATKELTLNKRPFIVKISDDHSYVFKLQNNLNLKTIYLWISPSFYPLFDKSYEFTK